MADKFLKTTATRKFNQAELRKLIQEQNTKIQKPKAVVQKIESPLAKYDPAGNLFCIICKIQVKPNVWKVHINSKQHKHKIDETKVIVEKSVELKTAIDKPNLLQSKTTVTKNFTSGTIEPISKSATINHSRILNVEQNTQKLTMIKPSTITTQQKNEIPKTNADKLESILPEKFFDDPSRDINGQIKDSSKDPLEEEWNRFQREIKEETSVSLKIESGQQDEAAIEREIEEIDEQLKRWKKVVEFENKTAQVLKNKYNLNTRTESSDSDDDTQIDSFIEFSDWRSKKLKL